MRQKRAKTYRKLMALYSLHFGFRQPYQVLVDSEMCKAAIALKEVDFYKLMADSLQGTVKPMITQCCIHELYLQGKEQQPAVDLAKSFERRKCNHKEAIPGDDCVSSVIGDKNKHRYVVATQSQPLRVKLRSIPAVPILHMNRSVMILEPPSDTTLRAKALAEQEALNPSTSEAARLRVSEPPQESPKKKKKGPKGPNPLSVKKKKTEVPPARKDGGVKDGGRQSSESRKSSTEDRPRVNVGEKRDREKDEVHGPQKGDGEELNGVGHKRKRRRKAGTPQPEPPAPPE
ncbi:Fcf1-domain-containing protein [Stereum hirsutum FP-91666 SS1]|uniref:Fcf1-domain-containing protein n=1 Tax=Stereum hirsutum (strain FP-91666) TaxID=721885 RepID=UPI000444A8F1|nr:Fcf1-domain-containing protein [Stereum hirsutum FP-91666 SS1]EIM83399.1 Fcf1-domain-containing protein [Stereum hirsutum FP-91666 SS1]